MVHPWHHGKLDTWMVQCETNLLWPSDAICRQRSWPDSIKPLPESMLTHHQLSFVHSHYDDVIMTMLASQITSLTVVYSIVYSGVNQRKHQSSASLAFVREIHRGPVNFPHKWPVTRKMFPFDDVIMTWQKKLQEGLKILIHKMSMKITHLKL